jgi:hypothetical protein
MSQASQKEVVVLEKEIHPFIVKAKQFIVIGNARGLEEASALRAHIKEYARNVKDRKEEVTKPLYKLYKDAMALFTPLEKDIEKALKIIDKSMSEYQTELRRVALEEEAKIAARVGEGKGKLKAETAMKQIDAVEKPQVKVGGTQFITVQQFEVIDKKEIPLEYMEVNEGKIRTAMNAGIQLPGVRYFTVERPRNSK